MDTLNCTAIGLTTVWGSLRVAPKSLLQDCYNLVLGKEWKGEEPGSTLDVGIVLAIPITNSILPVKESDGCKFDFELTNEN